MLINNAIVTGSLAVTGNSVLSGSLAISGSITTTGNITAQTLIVQTVTSSVSFITGSTRFGSLSSNTHQFTGSVLISGSSTALNVGNGNVQIGTISSADSVTISKSTYPQIRLVETTTSPNATAILGFDSPTTEWRLRTVTNHALTFGTNDTERMRITSAGDVGIGNTAFSSTRLTVTGKDNTSSNYAFVANDSSNNNLFLVRNDGAVISNTAFTMQAYSFAASGLQFTRAATNTVAPGSGNGILVFAGGNAQMRMDTSNGINFDMFNSGTPHVVLKLQQNGNTVVVNSPDNNLSLAFAYQGTTHAYMGGFSSALYAYSNNGGYVLLNSSGVWAAASDIKRKRNFETYPVGLNAILGLQPKLYNMDFQQDGDEKQVGLVAQEVKELIPLAYEENDKFIGLNYNAIIVTLINAVKELKAEIDDLKNK